MDKIKNPPSHLATFVTVGGAVGAGMAIWHVVYRLLPLMGPIGRALSQ